MLTSGDLDLVMAAYRYRYVTPSLLSKLAGRSAAVIRRRMRTELIPNGYICPMERAASETHVYCLAKGGFELVAHQLETTPENLPFSRKVKSARSFMLRHHLMVGRLRMAFDLACQKEGSPAVLLRAIPEWEMAAGIFCRNALGARRAKRPAHHERFVLSERLRRGHRAYAVRPDLGLVMHPRGHETRRTLMLVEADRSTEDHGRINAKMEGYLLYYEKQLFAVRFDAAAMRVLFVVEGARAAVRIQGMVGELRKMAERSELALRFSRCVRFAAACDIGEESVLAAPIWMDVAGEQRPFVRLESREVAA